MAMSSYSIGVGTQIDPYGISTAAEWVYFWSDTSPGYLSSGVYFKLLNDIDCGGVTVPIGGNYFYAVLDGNGFTVKNFTFKGGDYLFPSAGHTGTLKNINIDAIFPTAGWGSWNLGSFYSLSDVKFTIRGGLVFSYSGTYTGNNSGANKTNVLFDAQGGSAWGRDDSGAASNKIPASTYLLYPSSIASGYSNATKLAGADRFLVLNYPTLDWSKWAIIGNSSPIPSLQGYKPLPAAGDVAKNLPCHRMDWASTITKSQAYPGQIKIKELPDTLNCLCPINTPAQLISPPSLLDFGFIQGSITKKGQIATGQHVVCLDSRFNIVAETVSAADGSYRFDSLSIYDTYIIIAQDNWGFKYAPVGADRRTPEAYS